MVIKYKKKNKMYYKVEMKFKGDEVEEKKWERERLVKVVG